MLNNMTYVLNRICEDVQQEMAGKSKEDEIDWTVNAEILFFYALRGHKPVGVNRHFMMLLIHKKFSTYINREISSKVLWDHLDTMYDMSALHESEIIPFPNDEVDFELPEDCLDLLYSKHGVKFEKSSIENDVNKNSASSSKSAKKLTPKLKQSNTPSSTPKNNFASPVLNKPLKNEAAVKNEMKSSDAIPKAKQDLGLSSKGSKIKRSSSPFSNKVTKSEPLSLTKEDSPDILSNKKSCKLERGSSPAVLKKPMKFEPAVTNTTTKKLAKSESNSNGTKPVKSEVSDVSGKKIKPDKDLVVKKGKITSLPAEVSTKKPKVDVNSIKKKNENESSSKKTSESSSAKQVKAEVKSLSHSSKGHETGTPPPSGSRKSSPVVKIKGNESGKKVKRPKIEENSKKSTPAAKRRRI